MSEQPPAVQASQALAKTIGGDNLASGIATAVDAGADATISSLHGVPVLGVILGLAKAGIDVRKSLEFRKTVLFLEKIASVSPEKRRQFVDGLAKKNKLEEFGINILLLLDKIDDISKPKIVGRIMAAHINGCFDYEIAMRLCAMVGRAYASDLAYLLNFKPGTQGVGSTVAAMLAADGLLSQVGADGGYADDPNSGGILYALNEYSNLLIKHGLDD